MIRRTQSLLSVVTACVVLLVARSSVAEEPLKVCLVSGSLEYKSNESLAGFQKYLEANYPAKCSRAFLEGQNEEHLNGLENLSHCDVMLLFTRRLKLSGEQLATELCGRHGLELAICRPPMIYGCNAPGNYQRLRWLVARGIPIPRIAQSGRRSVLGIRNFCHALVAAVDHPRVLPGPWAVADHPAITYLEFARLLAEAMGRRLYTVPIPSLVLKGLLGVMGRAPDLSRICDDVVCDSAGSRELGWSAPHSTSDELVWAEGRMVL